MTIVNAIRCPECGDVIYSRTRHDFRNCSCGNVYIDGGLDYIRVGGKASPNVKVFELEIKATKKELYNDWNSSGNKYGLIKGDKK